jgi:hypothetical protein
MRQRISIHPAVASSPRQPRNFSNLRDSGKRIANKIFKFSDWSLADFFASLAAVAAPGLLCRHRLVNGIVLKLSGRR